MKNDATKVYLLRGVDDNNKKTITIVAAILVGLYLISQ